MKTLNELEVYLQYNELAETSYFTEPHYVTAIVGITQNEELIYDYGEMLQFLIDTEDMDIDEAEDFIAENTLRSIPYMSGNKPRIKYEID